MVEKRNIAFNEKLHTYTDEFGKSYTSVTTLIDKYAPKFDKEKWALIKAKEAGTTPEIIKASWEQITDYACEKGSKEHKLLEDSINNATYKREEKYSELKISIGLNIIINTTNLHILANSPLANKYPKIYNYLKEKIEEGWTLHCEKRIYWAEYLVAGTIDLLLIKGKFFIIVDWKTNKDKMMFKSGYYKKVNGIKTNTWVDKKEYMFRPIGFLEHCKGIKYTLQLSMYAYIMELWGFKCIGLRLFHIREVEGLTQYEIKYEKQASELLLIDNINGISMNSGTKKITNVGTTFGIY